MSSDAPAPSLAVVEDAPHLRTAWHPVFIRLLEHLLPADVWRVVAEYVLTREPRRIDAVIIRRVGTAPPGSPEYLRSVLDDLRDHNVVHFKGATDELEAADALQVLSYACQYMIHAGLGDPATVSLRVVAPTLTPRFRAQVQALGGSLVASAQEGVHTGALGVFELRVVETAVVWPQAHEHLLYAVSPACLQTPRPRTDAFDDRERELFYHLAQLIAQLASDPKWKEIMKDATLVEASAEATIQDLIAKLPAAWRLAGMKPEERLVGLKPEERLVGLKPEERLVGLKPEERLVGLKPEERLVGLKPEERLAGMKPEERLVGLKPEERLVGLKPEEVLARFEPEERLAGLDPAHAVLALPVEVLRGLTSDYLATLPDDVQATVRARLAATPQEAERRER